MDGQTTCDRKTALCTKVHCAVKTWLKRLVAKQLYLFIVVSVKNNDVVVVVGIKCNAISDYGTRSELLDVKQL